MRNTMNLDDLRQRMEVAVSTFYRLFGFMPSAEELSRELGSEYEAVLAEYSGKVVRIAG